MYLSNWLQLKQIDIDIEKRQKIDQVYQEDLKDIVGIKCLNFTNMEKGNYSYFPIILENKEQLNKKQ